jgi:hypothetical protein
MSTVTIMTAEREPVTVESIEQLGRFALTPAWSRSPHGGGKWTVTHLRTGWAAVSGVSLAGARGAMQAFEAMGDLWDDDDTERIRERVRADESLRLEVARILRGALMGQRVIDAPPARSISHPVGDPNVEWAQP